MVRSQDTASRPSGERLPAVRRVKGPHGRTHHFIAEAASEEEDCARTVMRTPAPTLPPTTGELAAIDPPLGDGAFVPGKLVDGRYLLGAPLGMGTFGVVYRATDQTMGRDVAIKILNTAYLANRQIVQRFLHEASAAARVSHPGIVTMFDCGLIEGSPSTGMYITMELLCGESLFARLERAGKLGPATAIEIARQTACALDAAHEVGVFHRDLKPDNIYLVPDLAVSLGERVKVIDFGLAKLGQTGQTRVESVFGTPRYMSPEQFRSATMADHRSDIYALGCVLFELVAGRAPFEGTLRDVIEGHQDAPIPRASSFSLEVSPALDDLIMQMLQKDPDRRPQTMAAVQRMLRSVEGDLTAKVAAPPYVARDVGMPPFVAPPRPVPSRLRDAWIIVAAIVFVVSGALTAVAVHGRSNGPRPVAKIERALG